MKEIKKYMIQKYPPFILEKIGKPVAPLLLSSPHSGTFYPQRLFELTDLKLLDFQAYEDAQVNKLFSFAPALGVPLLSAVYARAWIDLNRHPLELDETLFFDALPPQAKTDSVRVKKGFGVIAKQLKKNQLIYPKKLSFQKEQTRLFEVHFPYHQMLEKLIKANLSQFGYSILFDLHSMPSLGALGFSKGEPDFVLGTADGEACAYDLCAYVAETLEKLGFFVTINLPFSGAYTTQYYGRPSKKSHVIQIEVARRLYWDEKKYDVCENFNHLWHKMSVFLSSVVKELPSLYAQGVL